MVFYGDWNNNSLEHQFKYLITVIISYSQHQEGLLDAPLFY